MRQRRRVEQDLTFLRDERARIDCSGVTGWQQAPCPAITQTCGAMSALDIVLAALPMMSANQLREKWRALHCGEPMARASRDLLIREITYKLQERAHGGLAPAIKRRLRAMATEFAANGAGALALTPMLKPGTRLLREWGGKTYTVIVTDDGFDFEGERCQSLTQIARRITGAHWSGPRFFGLRRAGAKDE